MSAIDSKLPDLQAPVPGPRSLELAARLAQVESRNVTCLTPPPIFWQRASGANVWDVDGSRYIDLSGAFGVANAGHAHRAVVGAMNDQAARLLHGMGDVHPPAIKVELLEALVARYPGGVPARAVLGSSGADAVEAAVKTALLYTGCPGVIAFEGAYHGLALGALDLTWRSDFREPFRARLPHSTLFAPYGEVDGLKRLAREGGNSIGAVIIEPIQGRGGERVPPVGTLRALRELCSEQGWLLIADEVYTGFGRTGRWFACEHEGVVPDLLCVGKGLSSGMPISACLGREEVMNAWPLSGGEALHTQTFLGHPASCAAALASMRVIEEERLVEGAVEKGAAAMALLRRRLADRPAVREIRGRGLMIGIECDSTARAGEACDAALQRGVILLRSGEGGRVLSITPPLSIESDLLQHALGLVADCLS